MNLKFGVNLLGDLFAAATFYNISMVWAFYDLVTLLWLMNFLQNNFNAYFTILLGKLNGIWQKVVNDLHVPILVAIELAKNGLL